MLGEDLIAHMIFFYIAPTRQQIMSIVTVTPQIWYIGNRLTMDPGTNLYLFLALYKSLKLFLFELIDLDMLGIFIH